MHFPLVKYLKTMIYTLLYVFIHGFFEKIMSCIYAYNSSFSYLTLSKFIERLTSQYILCKSITLPDTRKEINFVKHAIPRTLLFLTQHYDHFVFQNSDLQQPLHQDEYFSSKSCKLLVLPSENICKKLSCRGHNI